MDGDRRRDTSTTTSRWRLEDLRDRGPDILVLHRNGHRGIRKTSQKPTLSVRIYASVQPARRTTRVAARTGQSDPSSAGHRGSDVSSRRSRSRLLDRGGGPAEDVSHRRAEEGRDAGSAQPTVRQALFSLLARVVVPEHDARPDQQTTAVPLTATMSIPLFWPRTS